MKPRSRSDALPPPDFIVAKATARSAWLRAWNLGNACVASQVRRALYEKRHGNDAEMKRRMHLAAAIGMVQLRWLEGCERRNAERMFVAEDL